VIIIGPSFRRSLREEFQDMLRKKNLKWERIPRVHKNDGIIIVRKKAGNFVGGKVVDKVYIVYLRVCTLIIC